MLTIILAETELELIPKKIFSHPSVISYSKKREKKPSEMVLDSSFHHSAMKHLPEGEKRGRPDIAHFFLINSLESILNKKGKLKIIIHTRNNEAIYFDPETRIMRSYHRFIGLIEQIFKKKKIETDDKTLIELKDGMELNKVIENESYDFLIVFSPNEKIINLFDYLKIIKEKNLNDILCVIGGFPHGDFHFDFSSYADDIISIYNEPLASWTVANELLTCYNNIF